MAKMKTDIIKLEQLHSEGLTVTEIAKRLGIAKGTASKQLKKLGLRVVKQALPEAKQIADKKFEAAEHLMFLVNKAKSELAWIDETVIPTSNAEYRAWLDQKLKFGAEMRKLISAVGDIGYKLFQAEEVKEVLRIIDEEIGHESQECQRRIRERVQRRRDIRFAGSLDR